MDRSTAPISLANSPLYMNSTPGGESEAGSSILCPTKPNMSITEVAAEPGTNQKFVVSVGSNRGSIFQFLLWSGCVPGLLAVGLNLVGQVDELHFERTNKGPEGHKEVIMTRYRRRCTTAWKDPPVVVEHVGHLEEEGGSGSPSMSPRGSREGRSEKSKRSSAGEMESGQSISASNSDSPSNSTNDQGEHKAADCVVVIDGVTGERKKEDHLVINGVKVVSGMLQNCTMDAEGDASTLIKGKWPHEPSS
jgi:hypothetical protein